MADEQDLLRWAEALAGIARTGLGFTDNLYERERFEDARVLRQAALRLLDVKVPPEGEKADAHSAASLTPAHYAGGPTRPGTTEEENSGPDEGGRWKEVAGAGDGSRTHDNNVGNVVLCQLSYTRTLAIF